MESMEKDLKMFEDLLNLPPVWDQLQSFIEYELSKWKDVKFTNTSFLINTTKKIYSYADYMGQLNAWEMKVLTKLFRKI